MEAERKRMEDLMNSQRLSLEQVSPILRGSSPRSTDDHPGGIRQVLLAGKLLLDVAAEVDSIPHRGVSRRRHRAFTRGSAHKCAPI